MPVTINKEQRLFVIPEGKGFSCLGFEVCGRWSQNIGRWLWVKGLLDKYTAKEIGTMESYDQLQKLYGMVKDHFDKTGERCPVMLTEQLVGLEHKRVEVVDCYGEKRRFIVGKSSGWLPIHIELCRRDSSGGGGVIGTPFQSIKIVT